MRSIFAQPDTDSPHEQHQRVVAQLEERLPEAAAMLEQAASEILATAQPKEHRRQVWSNNPLERLNREIRRRTDAVAIFPDRASIVRLVRAVLAEQNDERHIARRSISLDSIAKALTDPAHKPEEAIAIAAAAKPPRQDDALASAHHLDGRDPQLQPLAPAKALAGS